MPSSQSPNKTANNGQEEEIKIGIPIGGNSSFGDSFQEDQHSMIRPIWIKNQIAVFFSKTDIFTQGVQSEE